MSREEYDEGYAAGLHDAEELKAANDDLQDTITHLKKNAAEAQETRDEQDRSLRTYVGQIADIVGDIRREFGR